MIYDNDVSLEELGQKIILLLQKVCSNHKTNCSPRFFLFTSLKHSLKYFAFSLTFANVKIYSTLAPFSFLECAIEKRKWVWESFPRSEISQEHTVSVTCSI